ncbi:MAG TPA: hypothetical protein VGQ05_19535 [Streptosporangiaceae bacterium]|jgi:hypothetical protein|nr:hypothetical protein [Streptosporangiaceae bacterium]
MKLRHLGRVLIAAVPAALTVMTLTTGTASAMPRNPCEDYANEVNDYYNEYQHWNDQMLIDYDAGRMDDAFGDAQNAIFWREGYEDALRNAYNYGCF